MMPTLVIAGLALFVLFAGTAWWLRRRRAIPAAASLPAVAAGAPAASGAPAAAPGRTPAEPARAAVAAPQARALLHHLYAIAFDDAQVEDAAATSPPTHALVAAETEAVLARIEAQPRYTPRRPQLLPQLMRAANGPDASLDAIARIIGQDPALSANLLRIANSPFYRVQARPVESLARATALLGLDGLRPVIAAALVQPVMRTGEGVFGRFPPVVWEHTQLAAAAAADLARGEGPDDAFAAQLLGLLQGLGAIIVVQVMRDQYARHPDLPPDARVAARLLDDWAAPTARRIADSWGLSERIGRALDAQEADATPADPLGRALRVGRVAAALALLCRHERLADDEGQALLAAFVAGHGGTLPAHLWARLRA